MYAAVWLGAVGVLVLGGAYARLSLRRKHSHRRAYYRLTYACLVLSEVLYLPALLALPRTTAARRCRARGRRRTRRR